MCKVSNPLERSMSMTTYKANTSPMMNMSSFKPSTLALGSHIHGPPS